MRAIHTLLLLCALPCLAAPPVLPTYTPKPRPLKHTAGSKVGAGERTAYTYAAPKKAWTVLQLEWTHYGPGSQFIYFDVGGRYSISTPLSNSVVVATTSNTSYSLPFSTATQFYPAIRSWDKDQPKPSEWVPVGRIK